MGTLEILFPNWNINWFSVRAHLISTELTGEFSGAVVLSNFASSPGSTSLTALAAAFEAGGETHARAVYRAEHFESLTLFNAVYNPLGGTPGAITFTQPLGSVPEQYSFDHSTGHFGYAFELTNPGFDATTFAATWSPTARHLAWGFANWQLATPTFTETMVGELLDQTGNHHSVPLTSAIAPGDMLIVYWAYRGTQGAGSSDRPVMVVTDAGAATRQGVKGLTEWLPDFGGGLPVAVDDTGAAVSFTDGLTDITGATIEVLQFVKGLHAVPYLVPLGGTPAV